MSHSDDLLEELWERDGVRARIALQGEWRLDSDWRPFTAMLVVHEAHAFVWRARAQVGKVVVRGFESLFNDAGTMDWRLFGRVPALQRSGADIDRSMRGRWLAESMWLRESFGGPLPDHDEGLALDGDRFCVERWGAPDGDDRYAWLRYEGRRLDTGWEVGWADREPLLRFEATEIERA